MYFTCSRLDRLGPPPYCPLAAVYGALARSTECRVNVYFDIGATHQILPIDPLYHQISHLLAEPAAYQFMKRGELRVFNNRSSVAHYCIVPKGCLTDLRLHLLRNGTVAILFAAMLYRIQRQAVLKTIMRDRLRKGCLMCPPQCLRWGHSGVPQGSLSTSTQPAPLGALAPPFTYT